MQIDINHLLRAETGVRDTYEIDGERPDLEDVVLKAPITGSITVMRTRDGIEMNGRLSATVEIECDRCLRPFEYQLEYPLAACFAEKPDEDQFAIDRYGKINIDEAVRQDLLVRLPQQRLCQEDCKGIELTNQQHKETHGRT